MDLSSNHPMKTEDDTFRILKRTPPEEMYDLWWNWYLSSEEEGIETKLNRYGWTLEEFRPVWDKIHKIRLVE